MKENRIKRFNKNSELNIFDVMYSELREEVLENESNNANTLLCDVDFTKLSDKELMSIGLKLMRSSVRNLLNKDAKEHTEFDRYMDEVERRQNNVI